MATKKKKDGIFSKIKKGFQLGASAYNQLGKSGGNPVEASKSALKIQKKEDRQQETNRKVRGGYSRKEWAKMTKPQRKAALRNRGK